MDAPRTRKPCSYAVQVHKHYTITSSLGLDLFSSISFIAGFHNHLGIILSRRKKILIKSTSLNMVMVKKCLSTNKISFSLIFCNKHTLRNIQVHIKSVYFFLHTRCVLNISRMTISSMKMLGHKGQRDFKFLELEFS